MRSFYLCYPQERIRQALIAKSDKKKNISQLPTMQELADALPNKTLVREYMTQLPNEKILVAEIERTRKVLEERGR